MTRLAQRYQVGQAIGFFIPVYAVKAKRRDVMHVQLSSEFFLGDAAVLARVSVAPTRLTPLCLPVGTVVRNAAAAPGWVAIVGHFLRMRRVLTFVGAVRILMAAQVTRKANNRSAAPGALKFHPTPDRAIGPSEVFGLIGPHALPVTELVFTMLNTILCPHQLLSAGSTTNSNAMVLMVLVAAFPGAIMVTVPAKVMLPKRDGLSTSTARSLRGAATPIAGQRPYLIFGTPSALARLGAKVTRTASHLVRISIQRLSALRASCVGFFHVSPNKHPAGPCRLVVQTNRGQRDELMSIRPTSVCLDAGILSQFLKSVKSGREAIP